MRCRSSSPDLGPPVDRVGGRELDRPQHQFRRLPVAIRHVGQPTRTGPATCSRSTSIHHRRVDQSRAADLVGPDPAGCQTAARPRLIATWDPVAEHAHTVRMEHRVRRPTASPHRRHSGTDCRPSRRTPTVRTCCSTCADRTLKKCATAASSAIARTSSAISSTATRPTSAPSNESIQPSSYLAFEAARHTPAAALHRRERRHAACLRRGDGQRTIRLHSARRVRNLDQSASSPYYNAQHHFYVNGSPQAADVQFADNTWHTLAGGTEAQGGNSVFAIDVTDPARITTEAALANAVLWDFTDADMGLGFSNSGDRRYRQRLAGVFRQRLQQPAPEAVPVCAESADRRASMRRSICAPPCRPPAICALANGLSSLIAVNTSGSDRGARTWSMPAICRVTCGASTSPTPIRRSWAVTVLFQARDRRQHRSPSPPRRSPPSIRNIRRCSARWCSSAPVNSWARRTSPNPTSSRFTACTIRPPAMSRRCCARTCCSRRWRRPRSAERRCARSPEPRLSSRPTRDGTSI